MDIHKPPGTRDFLPEEMLRRRYAEARLREIAAHWGYSEIKTPTFEHLELFTLKSGEAIVGQIYNFIDKGDREMALRPELTAPVMRMYVEKLQVAPKPLKLYYYDNCFRYERAQRGRFREFWQFGVELIGSEEPEADAEVIALAVEMLEAVGVKGDLHVGHLGIIRHLLKEIPPEVQTRIMRLVDKKDDKALEDYLDEIAAPGELRASLFHLIGLRGSSAVVEARKILGDIEPLVRLEEILRILETYMIKYIVDLGIARGLDYYTGMVFEVYSEGLGAQNQVCGGGAYRLAHLFGGEDIPSTGFALGFDRILEVCKVKPPQDKLVVVTCFEDTRKEAIEITRQLRKHIPAYLDVMGRKFKEQLAHANTLGARHVVIVGKKELQEGKVALKDMETGAQGLLSIEEVIQRLKGTTKQKEISDC